VDIRCFYSTKDFAEIKHLQRRLNVETLSKDMMFWESEQGNDQNSDAKRALTTICITHQNSEKASAMRTELVRLQICSYWWVTIVTGSWRTNKSREFWYSEFNSKQKGAHCWCCISAFEPRVAVSSRQRNKPAQSEWTEAWFYSSKMLCTTLCQNSQATSRRQSRRSFNVFGVDGWSNISQCA